MSLSDDVKIRLSQESDVTDLVSFLSDPDVLEFQPMSNQQEVLESAKMWVSYSRIGACFTAINRNKVCGVANLYLQFYEKTRQQALFAIIVNPKMRGNGIGTKMIQHLESQAKETFKVRLLHLEVYRGNPAVRLYERLGYSHYGVHPKFLKTEDGSYKDKLLMQKEL